MGNKQTRMRSAANANLKEADITNIIKNITAANAANANKTVNNNGKRNRSPTVNTNTLLKGLDESNEGYNTNTAEAELRKLAEEIGYTGFKGGNRSKTKRRKTKQRKTKKCRKSASRF